MRPLLALFALCAAPPALAAQRAGTPPAASGFWYGGGVGVGWARVSCTICRGDIENGPAGFVRLGGTVGPHVLVGAEVAAWFHGDDQVDENAWAVSAAAYWYPSRTGGWYLKSGLGYTTHSVDDGVDVVRTYGFGPQVGAGYEFPVGRDWRLGPFVNASFGVMMGKVKFNGGTAADDGNASVVQIGMGVLKR